MMPAVRMVCAIMLIWLSLTARAEIVATYLGNEAVLVAYGDSKILFDPLYRNGYDIYQLVPAEMEEAIFEGTAPFDSLDAVFVSHHHEDHFSPSEMARLLSQNPQLRLYAPAQAVAGMLEFITDDTVLERVAGIDLQYGDPPITLHEGHLTVSAVRIPHTGWPETWSDIENIAFRVTLDDEATVLHIGDADTDDKHYAQDAEHWRSRQIDMAFPPYWYFSSGKGRHVLTTRLKPRHSVGVHVPLDMPDNPSDRPAEYRGYDLFTEPGQSRRIEITQ